MQTKDIDEAVAAIQEGTCTELDCREAGWGAGEAARLAAALREAAPNPQLTVLWLSFNDFGAAGCAPFFAALGDGACPQLAWLDLDSTGLGAAGCALLVAALEAGACPRLTWLDVSNNMIGEEMQTRVEATLERTAAPC